MNGAIALCWRIISLMLSICIILTIATGIPYYLTFIEDFYSSLEEPTKEKTEEEHKSEYAFVKVALKLPKICRYNEKECLRPRDRYDILRKVRTCFNTQVLRDCIKEANTVNNVNECISSCEPNPRCFSDGEMDPDKKGCYHGDSY